MRSKIPRYFIKMAANRTKVAGEPRLVERFRGRRLIGRTRTTLREKKTSKNKKADYKRTDYRRRVPTKRPERLNKKHKTTSTRRLGSLGTPRERSQESSPLGGGSRSSS
ncbi:hypothetical protein ISCGN_021208 [Ixodes scapularis]